MSETDAEDRSDSGHRHPVAIGGDGEHIVPAEAESSVAHDCPTESCDDPLYARGPSVTGTVRHYYHPGTGCGGGGVGESDIHRLACSHAASALGIFYDDVIEETATDDRFRVTLDVADTPSPVDTREADALCTFIDSERGHPFGNGLAIEVQYKHDDKDIEAVTTDYHLRGYSVVWFDATENFDTDGYRFDRAELEAAARAVWPAETDERRTDPLLTSERILADVRAQCAARPPLDVPLPADSIDDYRDILYTAYRLGAGIEASDFDLAYRLSENNARRSCGGCGGSGDWYLSIVGVLSGFWCDDCAPLAAA